MHPLFSVCVVVYSTECRFFACLGKLPAEGLLLVMEIPPDFFAARRSVCAVPRSYNIAHLRGIFLLDWQTKPYEQAVGTDHINLAFRGMALFSSNCEAWRLLREVDRSVIVFEALAGLFPMLIGREPPFEAALDW